MRANKWVWISRIVLFALIVCLSFTVGSTLVRDDMLIGLDALPRWWELNTFLWLPYPGYGIMPWDITVSTTTGTWDFLHTYWGSSILFILTLFWWAFLSHLTVRLGHFIYRKLIRREGKTSRSDTKASSRRVTNRATRILTYLLLIAIIGFFMISPIFFNENTKHIEIEGQEYDIEVSLNRDFFPSFSSKTGALGASITIIPADKNNFDTSLDLNKIRLTNSFGQTWEPDIDDGNLKDWYDWSHPGTVKKLLAFGGGPKGRNSFPVDVTIKIIGRNDKAYTLRFKGVFVSTSS